MSKVNILEVLSRIGGSVVLKEGERFPDYESGDDVDLLVLDRYDTVQKIVEYFEQKHSDEGELKITDNTEHCHVDFFFKGDLDLRIDIVDHFDFYTKFSIKDGFVVKIFMDRIKKKDNSYFYYVPCMEDELTIRYFEYLEYFDHYPDKIKHLKYICDIEDEELKKRFFANTHRFIRFRRRTWNEFGRGQSKNSEPDSRREALNSLKKNFRFIVTTTLKIWAKKVFRRD